MPLHDHFHGALVSRPWASVHSQWACAIAANLNRRLPKRFVADAPMYLGANASADVAEYELTANELSNIENEDPGGGIAVATQLRTQQQTELELYTPPVTNLAMPADFPIEIKVEIRDTIDAYQVIAVLEIVSPSNKKESGDRQQFAAKCLSYLRQGIGLVVIDIVTSRHWNLHNELIRLAQHDEKFLMADEHHTYVCAYRPIHREQKDVIDLWHWALAVGAVLPEVPLALKGYGCVKLELEATYLEACQRLRISE